MGDRYSVRPNWGFWLRERERERDQLGITESGSGFTVQEYMYVYCVKGNK